MSILDPWVSLFKDELSMIKKTPAVFSVLVGIFSVIGALSLYGLMNWGMWNVLQMKNEYIATLEKASDPEKKEVMLKWEDRKKTPIIGKEFRNETVLLDGFSYVDCTFINVKLQYNGTAPFDMAHNVIDGDFWIDTNSQSIATFIKLLHHFNFLRPGLPIQGLR